MPFTVRMTGLPFDRVLATAMTREDWRFVGDLARIAIVERTRRGEAPDGVTWPAYSPGYAKQKFEELGDTPVNLTVSGEMLNNLRIVDVTETSVTLGWTR